MGKPKRIRCKTREEWLSKRNIGIGASESAAILGLSPWKTANDLWLEKTGNRMPKDLSDDPYMQKGVRLEPALRELVRAVHPEFKIYHEPYDMWYQPGREWMFATLDGRIKTEDGKVGVLEIKTATPNGKNGWAEWQNKVPDKYYIQCTHQCACLDADFVILFGCLFNMESDFVVREYRFEREDLKADMDYLIQKEEAFWQSVQNKTLPPMTLIL